MSRRSPAPWRDVKAGIAERGRRELLDERIRQAHHDDNEYLARYFVEDGDEGAVSFLAGWVMSTMRRRGEAVPALAEIRDAVRAFYRSLHRAEATTK